MHSPDKPRIVYCNPCWWSDKWDGAQFAMDYDPNRNFFDQFRELQQRVPFMALLVDHPSMSNSYYTNHASYLKNCYYVFNAGPDENCAYMNGTSHSKDCLDGSNVQGSELCYDNVGIEKCFNVHFSEDIEASHNIYFSKNLTGCSDCFGCVNLRNRQYHIFNESYTPEEYKKKLVTYGLGSFQSVERIRNDARAFWLRYPQKYMHGSHNTNVSGDYIYNAKNITEGYLVLNGEDLKFSQWITLPRAKDAYDYTEWGEGAERLYECISVGRGVSSIKMSAAVWMANTINVEYSMYVLASHDMFGCIGVRKKEYSILNKSYRSEEYQRIRQEIIRSMQERPYTDSRGRIFSYGEFFPYDLSLYDYNESSAEDYFPLSKEETESNGWRWKDHEESRHAITTEARDLRDDIKDIADSIVKEAISCAKCGRAYRIIPQELDLLRRFGLPLPHRCFECRNQERLRRMTPMRFWRRQCQCAGVHSSNGVYTNQAAHSHGGAVCPNEFETSYAPDRPEIVYCEQCYNADVV